MDPSTGARSSDDGFRPSGFGLPGKGLASRQPVLSDPDRVVTRLDNFISAYGARATLFELWHSNPAIFDLLLLLFDRSEFLAELAIRTPDLVDELVTSGRLRQRKSAEATLRDLRHGLKDEDQALWLRKYHQTEVMRIGLRDILGLAGYEQYLTELSSLADACLQYALEAVMRQHKIKSPPFVIVGLGKLGGAEIDYGSDLDILFVADPKAKNLLKSKTWRWRCSNWSRAERNRVWSFTPTPVCGPTVKRGCWLTASRLTRSTTAAGQCSGKSRH